MYRAFKAMPADDVEGQVAALQELQGVYNQAASMGSPEWAVASLWRIGNGLAHIAQVVEATPVPAEITKPADIEQFRQAIKNNVDPLKQQAKSAFEACLSRADQLDVFTAAVVGCRTEKDTAQLPLRGAPPERAVNVDELRGKAEQTQSAQDFEALGVAYLGAYHVHDAILNLNRAVELEDNRASAHSALGYAFLLTKDGNAARAEYGRALEADPTYEKARANLAALKCRFLDKEGARRELSVIKDPGALSGPDVDPEWKSCK